MGHTSRQKQQTEEMLKQQSENSLEQRQKSSLRVPSKDSPSADSVGSVPYTYNLEVKKGTTLGNAIEEFKENAKKALEDRETREALKEFDTILVKEQERLSAQAKAASEKANTDTAYLQYAPEEFKALWETASPVDKEVYKKHVEFTADGPNIIGASGTTYELAKENLTVADQDFKKGEIDKHNGETYFDWDALMDYTKKHTISLPTDEMYLDMLKVMPAGDIEAKYVWGVGGRQLFSILGGKFNGFLLDGKHNNFVYGYLWSASHGDDLYAFALASYDTGGKLFNFFRVSQFPARSLRAPK